MHKKPTRIAIVYDWIDKWGGVERVLLHLHKLFPQAEFFTSAYDVKKAPWADSFTVHTTFLQSIPSFIRSYRSLLTILFPLAFESFRFDEYDLIISVTSSFAKGVITKPGTSHICYLLTPPRYLWSHLTEYISRAVHFFVQPIISHLQQWDIYSSTRPDAIISISNSVAERAKKTYNVDSSVIYPPFDTDYWDKRKKEMYKPQGIHCAEPYYLWVGRMESYKKPELIIEVAKQLSKHHFIFVGVGALSNKLRRNAPKNCQFAGFVPDNELAYLYAHAEALIMPQNEDFGYVSLESQYCGCPVIAFRSGGACETIKEEESGLFFDQQTASSIVSRLERFEQISYNLRRTTHHRGEAIKSEFGTKRFHDQLIYQLQKHISL